MSAGIARAEREKKTTMRHQILKCRKDGKEEK